MGRATKKPVTIDFVLLEDTDQSIYKAQKFIDGKVDNNSCRRAEDAWDTYLNLVTKEGGIKIHTLEGVHLASFGDYIIKGVKGEFYPCKPDIFHLTYDIIDA